VEQLLLMGDKGQGGKKYTAMGKWATQLRAIHNSVLAKMQ
jgi:hypothetical protein